MVNRNLSVSGVARCLMLLGGLLSLPACGDGPTCPSDLVAVIQSPGTGLRLSAADDQDLDTAGTQVDVSVRSNLKSGDSFELTVTDSTGAVALHQATASSDGDVTFANVTLPGGILTLSVTGSSDCGTASDEVEVTVLTNSPCSLNIDNGPIDNAFYEPIPVLNSSVDDDDGLPNFQASLSVNATPGVSVEVFVLDTETGSEASIGVSDADTDGVAAFEATLAQGRQALRATCGTEASATHTVQVDTIVPTCELLSPEPGVTITPDFDTDSGLDGVQMTWSGSVNDGADNDTEGESASFFRGMLEFDAGTVAAGGSASTANGEFTAPGTFAMEFITQDHAGNACSASSDIDVIMEGCSIAFIQPSALVTVDSNANAAGGMQANFVVDIGTECAGLNAFVNCGNGEVSAVIPGDGRTTLANVTLNTDATSEGLVNCTARVVNSANFETSDTQPVTWDTQAPGPVLLFSNGRACGDSVVFDVANDFNANLADGLQIRVSAVATGATERDIQIINSACNSPSCITANVPTTPVAITLEPGDNDIRVIARDAVGNEAITTACNITLADIVVTIDDPVDTGTLNSTDGTVNGANLEITVCGTVSLADSTVTLNVDAGATFPTTVTAGAWCTNAPVSLSEGNHVLVANATSNADARVGSFTRNVAVDITGPAAPGNLSADSPNRQQIDMSWNASAGAASYEVRFSTTAFTDFLNEGTAVAVPGVDTNVSITALRSDLTYFVGVVALDAAGNPSAATTVGPIIPLLDASGIVAPPPTDGGLGGEPDNKQFATRLAGGDYNNDGFADVAVAAPLQSSAAGASAGVVYIYFGSATGLATTPGVTIPGVVANGRLGQGLTKIRWSGQPGDDLALSAYNVGEIYIYNSSTITAALAGTGVTTAADLTITPGAGSWFDAFGGVGFGYSLAAGQLNAIGTPEELIIGVALGGSVGGVAVVYGGPLTDTGDTAIELDDTNAASMNGLRGHYFQNPHPANTAFSLLGNKVAYLGDTRAGDGVGDLAVGYFADTDTDPDRVYVLRGRTVLPASGMTEITFDGTRDLEVAFTSADTTTAFGEHIGSIAGTGGGLRDLVISSAIEETNAGSIYIVDASRVGIQALTSTTGFITRISGATSQRFGAAIVNNGAGLGNDINDDGTEDLVIAGGRGVGMGLYVWYGDTLPTGGADILATTRDYFTAAPVGFVNNQTAGAPLSLQADWVGDVNNDGLDDICWGDNKATGTNGTVQEGTFETLFDDGV